MQSMIDVLKSRGKLGGMGLMVLGMAHMVGVFFGKLAGDYSVGGAMLLAGLSLLGVRGALDAPK